MRIVALSDTHSLHNKVTVPDGDVLIHAGDFMNTGYDFNEAKYFAEWWNALPHKTKILVAGNHDRQMESNEKICLRYFNNTIYLKDSGVMVAGKLFWGSPYQPEFCNWAFNVRRGEFIKKHWDLIPDRTDVLITHGPPMGILDQTEGWGNQHVGCEELLKRVQQVNPLYHIFGHIHAGYGISVTPETNSRTIFRNVSICNEQYQPVHVPHVFDL